MSHWFLERLDDLTSGAPFVTPEVRSVIALRSEVERLLALDQTPEIKIRPAEIEVAERIAKIFRNLGYNCSEVHRRESLFDSTRLIVK